MRNSVRGSSQRGGSDRRPHHLPVLMPHTTRLEPTPTSGRGRGGADEANHGVAIDTPQAYRQPFPHSSSAPARGRSGQGQPAHVFGRGQGNAGSQRDQQAEIALWSAVALQAHMVKSIRSTGLLPRNPTVRVPGQPPPLLPAVSSSFTTPSNPLPANRGLDGAPLRSGALLQKQRQAEEADRALLFDEPPTRLTLAQKMGLVEAPPPAPSTEEWQLVLERVAQRGDAVRPCAICHESFLLTTCGSGSEKRPQVVLDCSHVFHLTCLKQFEKFVRRAGGDRSCPVCRKKHYHKRIHFEAAAQLQNHAAAKIQAAMRGFLARKRFLKLRLQTNPKFRGDYYFNKLSEMTDRYLAYSVAREKEVDRFLEDIELKRQRAAAEMMSKKDWQILREKAWAAIRGRREVRDERSQPSAAVVTAKIDNSGNWIEDPTTMASGGGCAHDGGEGLECPICMASLQPKVPGDVYLLSCGHCFHQPCLTTFESFTTAAVRNTNGHPPLSSSTGPTLIIPRCPLCRAGYIQQSLVLA